MLKLEQDVPHGGERPLKQEFFGVFLKECRVYKHFRAQHNNISPLAQLCSTLVDQNVHSPLNNKREKKTSAKIWSWVKSQGKQTIMSDYAKRHVQEKLKLLGL